MIGEPIYLIRRELECYPIQVECPLGRHPGYTWRTKRAGDDHWYVGGLYEDGHIVWRKVILLPNSLIVGGIIDENKYNLPRRCWRITTANVVIEWDPKPGGHAQIRLDSCLNSDNMLTRSINLLVHPGKLVVQEEWWMHEDYQIDLMVNEQQILEQVNSIMVLRSKDVETDINFVLRVPEECC